jgi:hypothetical protein
MPRCGRWPQHTPRATSTAASRAAHPSAALTVSSSAIVGSHRSGISAEKPGATLDATDTVIRDTVPDTDRPYAVGITSWSAQASLTRCTVAGTVGPGVVGVYPGADFQITDCTIAHNDSDPPTFSRSKAMETTFDVQRDHVGLLLAAAKLLEPDGVLLHQLPALQDRRPGTGASPPGARR